MKNFTHKKLNQSSIKINHKESGFKKKIILKQFQLPNGLTETFFIDENKDSVCIFPLTKDNKIILVSQFRAGPEKVQLELPGGGLEPSEDLLEAAKRELIEETGFEVVNEDDGGAWIHLASLPYNPYSTGIRHCFMAVGCEKTSKRDLDPNEFLNVHQMDLSEFKKMKKDFIRGFEVIFLGLDLLEKQNYKF